MQTQNLEIAGTLSSPRVHSDWESGRLMLEGDSYPENSFEFFQPIIDWVRAYLREGTAPLAVELRLLYLNTSSVRAMMEVFDTLEAAHQGGREVDVCWFYAGENNRIAELAEEFKEDCTFPFAVKKMEG